MDDLSKCRIAILGLGLMGGSLAMALRGQCGELIGIDPDRKTLEFADQNRIVDRSLNNLKELSSAVDLIVLAAPVREILKVLDELPQLNRFEGKVFDLGSTKSCILEKMNNLPERFDPLGGHPMCGKEVGGIRHADPNIFLGAPFALTPLPRSSDSAKNLAEQLVSTIGSKAIWLDADTHDRWVAATSHLPFLIANTLAGLTPSETSPLVGSGFRSTTRLAATPADMMGDVIWTNRENIISGIKRFKDQIDIVQSALEIGDEEALQRMLTQGSERYWSLIQ